MKHKIFKRIIYSRTKLKYGFLFGDEFKIYPQNTQYNDTKGVYFPAIIEYKVWYPDSIPRSVRWRNVPDDAYENLYLSVKEFKKVSFLIHLFTAASNSTFYIRDGNVNRSNFPNRPEISARFSGVIPESNSGKNMEGDGAILHSELNEILNKFYNRLEEEREIIKSGIHLIYHGIVAAEELHDYSLSFISLVSGIETLLSLEFSNKPEKCECCGNLKYQVTKKFISFLMKYVGSSREEKKLYNSIYSKRSKISHTGSLFMTNLEGFIEDDFLKESELYYETSKISKKAFVNWILNKTAGNAAI